MRIKVTPLHKRAKALLPTRVSNALGLHELRPLALQLFLLMVHRWSQRVEHELRFVAPSKRTIDAFTFEVKLRELQAHLRPDSACLKASRDYRRVREAIDTLASLQVTTDLPDVRGKRGRTIHNLIAQVEYREEGSMLRFSLSPFLKHALMALEAQGAAFTLVPIADALALDESRHLLMLLLAAQVAKLHVPDRRTFDVTWLRAYFGLAGPSYDEWRFAHRKLRDFAAAVTQRTGFRVKLAPVHDRCDSRRIVAVRFDVKHRDSQPEVPAIEHKPKPTFSPLARKLLLLRDGLDREREREGGSCVTDIDD